ncbi:alpha/beta fold hydrolase [Halomonas sp.]|uniref:alpha/beta hydrolase n=1 Tax=Halomonas sp. TaxID=1486246 RepID=UPI00257F7519|nr:alpha/beta fold hydrolase [Halomonas sp.]MCJ8287211.1 alpha/beta fold hydrolase [Halomonas sp.]NQY71926.1 alpha/beta fold hydrolase [Halomonas sp.]
MQSERVSIVSDGFKLDGAYYWDDGVVKDNAPVVISCSGFTGLKHIHPERFARYLSKQGFLCFGFDYRGFGESEGARGKVLLEEQVRDIANVVAYVRARADAEGRKLVLAGWGMAGGLVLDAYRQVEDLIDALISMNGFFDAVRVQKALRGELGWKEFRHFLNQERLRLSQGGEARDIDPFDIYPLDPISKGYVDSVLWKTPGYGLTSDLDFADSLIAFRPESHIDERFANTPLLIAHGGENDLHPVTEARSLYATYPGPKTLFLLPGGGHTEWMLDEDAKFQTFAGRISDWLEQTV